MGMLKDIRTQRVDAEKIPREFERDPVDLPRLDIWGWSVSREQP